MKVSPEMFARWSKYADLRMADYGKSVNDVNSPGLAWYVAHSLDIPKEAYHVGMNYNHIETALRRIFPNAWRSKGA